MRFEDIVENLENAQIFCSDNGSFCFYLLFKIFLFFLFNSSAFARVRQTKNAPGVIFVRVCARERERQ